jgi:hypothetical protein
VPVAASTGLTPEERSLRGRIAGYSSWEKTLDRTARTQRGRDAFRESFADKIDPDHLLPPVERAKRGEAAYKAHMARLAFNSAKARRQRKSVDATNAGPNNRRSSKSESASDVVSA